MAKNSLYDGLMAGEVDSQGRPKKTSVKGNPYQLNQNNPVSTPDAGALMNQGAKEISLSGANNPNWTGLNNTGTTKAPVGSNLSWASTNAGTIGTAAVAGASTYAATGDVSKGLEGAAASIPVYGQIAGLAFAGRDITKQGLDSGLLSSGKNEYGDYTHKSEQGMNAALTTVHENVINKAGDGDWLGAGQSLINPAGDILNGFFGKKDTSGEDAFKKQQASKEKERLDAMYKERVKNNPYLNNTAARPIVNNNLYDTITSVKNGGKLKTNIY